MNEITQTQTTAANIINFSNEQLGSNPQRKLSKIGGNYFRWRNLTEVSFLELVVVLVLIYAIIREINKK